MSKPIWIRLRSVLDRDADATSVELSRESAEEMLDEIKRLTAEVEWHKKNSDKWQDTQAAHLREVARLTSENEKLGRDYQFARDAHDKVLAENEKLRAALDVLQAAMTAKKPIPLALKKAIIEARAALSGDKHE